MSFLHEDLIRSDPFSGQQPIHHISCNICEAVIATRVAERQLFMIQAQKVQDGGMEIVHVDGVAGDVDAVVIGGAINAAGLDARACEP